MGRSALTRRRGSIRVGGTFSDGPFWFSLSRGLRRDSQVRGSAGVRTSRHTSVRVSGPLAEARPRRAAPATKRAMAQPTVAAAIRVALRNRSAKTRG
jgi:hypothetical protein